MNHTEKARDIFDSFDWRNGEVEDFLRVVAQALAEVEIKMLEDLARGIEKFYLPAISPQSLREKAQAIRAEIKGEAK